MAVESLANRQQIEQNLRELDPSDSSYATDFVDLLLASSRVERVSDVHLQPTDDGLEVRWRLDGVLQLVGRFPRGDAADVVSRLKVLAELLTYRSDAPQEGRIRQARGNVEIRVSTFPTLHGERAVVRFFASEGQFLHVHDLNLPREVADCVQHLLAETSGALVISGPAGSGKTTTAYACLRELVQQSKGGKSIVSLEDPIEVAVDQVAQAQVNISSGFDLASGLRSLMRQDPEVILVGEIRDHETAEAVFQAALTGHLVVTTFHAGSAAGAISRISDMGIEPYLLRSGVLAILNQRLVRRLCHCAQQTQDESAKLGLAVEQFHIATGCPDCDQIGYKKRAVIAELLLAQPGAVGRAILSRSDAPRLQELAVQSGMVPLFSRASDAVRAGITSPAEIRRVFGFGESSRDSS